MTNQVAIVLFLLIIGALTYDAVAYDWQNTVFVAKQFNDFIEWLAFWR